MSWLERSILDASRAVPSAEGLSEAAAASLRRRPVSGWELERWSRGLRLGLIRLEGHRLRLGSGPRRLLIVFSTAAGPAPRRWSVVFRREALTQAAAYVALVTDYGYGRERVRFEADQLDVACAGDGARPMLSAEANASEKGLERLLGALEGGFADGLPPLAEDAPAPEPWHKAQRILKRMPGVLWAVAPEDRRAYEVVYAGAGFRLKRLSDLPRSAE